VLWSPTIRAALLAGTPWLDIFCPGCGTSRAIDIRAIDTHPLASVGTLVLGLRPDRGPSRLERPQGLPGRGDQRSQGPDERPAFDGLCKDAARRQFDMVMAWSVDRLGRSLQDLIGFLSELHALGIDLMLHQQGLDTTTPAGKAMFQMMGVFAEFERAMIREG
jgi:hypothetical protein